MTCSWPNWRKSHAKDVVSVLYVMFSHHVKLSWQASFRILSNRIYIHPFEDRKCYPLRCNSSTFLKPQLLTLESLPATYSWELLEIIERHDSCLFSKFQIIQFCIGLLSGEIQIHQSYANKYRRFASPLRNSNFLLSPQGCLGEIMHTIELFMSRPCAEDFCLIRTFSFFP